MRPLALAALALVLAGCGGSAAAEDAGTPVAAADGTPAPELGRELVRFVAAAGRGDTAATWALLSPQTQATMGPTYPEFRRGLAADLADDLGRQTGAPEPVLARRVGRWGLATVTGTRVVDGEEEPYAYAAAFRRVGATWRLELGGAVAAGLLPGHLDESDGTPTLAATIYASGRLERTLLWLDPEPVSLRREEQGPFVWRVRHEVEEELPDGWHVATALATTADTAAASAWAFDVRD